MINGQSGTYVQITADKIDLSGYVTANQFASDIGMFYNATTGTLSANWVTSAGGQFNNLTVSGSLNIGVGHTVSIIPIVIDGVTHHIVAED